MLVFSPSQHLLPIPQTEFEKQVLDFCAAWKDGQKEFTFHTSGSTGPPKPIKVHRKTMEASAQMTATWLNLKSGDTALLCLPMHYIAGAMVVVRALVLDLQVIVVEPSTHPLDEVDISIALASFVPNQWFQLLKNPAKIQSIFGHSKGILIGGAGIDVDLALRTSDFKLPIFLTYGMTETVSHVAFQKIDKENQTFTVLPGIEIKQDEANCLAICGPVTNSMWVQTRDVVSISDTNHFDWLGRLDRVINSAGKKIQAERVENALMGIIPDRYFVVGIPDHEFGQKVVVFIASSSNTLTLQTITSFLQRKIESWEMPKEIIYVPEFFETSSGKIDQLKTVTLHLNSN